MNPMRWHISCPDCGFVESEIESQKRYVKTKGAGYFDCPRCGAHYAADDFHDELDAKHMAQHHNHAKADLTSEEL